MAPDAASAAMPEHPRKWRVWIRLAWCAKKVLQSPGGVRPDDPVYVIFRINRAAQRCTGPASLFEPPHIHGQELQMGPDRVFPALASFAFDMHPRTLSGTCHRRKVLLAGPDGIKRKNWRRYSAGEPPLFMPLRRRGVSCWRPDIAARAKRAIGANRCRASSAPVCWRPTTRSTTSRSNGNDCMVSVHHFCSR